MTVPLIGSCFFQFNEDITNRWSSRLGGRLGLRVAPRKEPRPVVVVGGAAQLYVISPKRLDSAASKIHIDAYENYAQYRQRSSEGSRQTDWHLRKNCAGQNGPGSAYREGKCETIGRSWWN